MPSEPLRYAYITKQVFTRQSSPTQSFESNDILKSNRVDKDADTRDVKKLEGIPPRSEHGRSLLETSGVDLEALRVPDLHRVYDCISDRIVTERNGFATLLGIYPSPCLFASIGFITFMTLLVTSLPGKMSPVNVFHNG